MCGFPTVWRPSRSRLRHFLIFHHDNRYNDATRSLTSPLKPPSVPTYRSIVCLRLVPDRATGRLLPKVVMAFSKLGLSEALVRAVTEHGYTIPTPIQVQAIPAVLAGGDLLAGAQTGTGKTAGFVLPMLQRLSTRPSPYGTGARKPVRALILAPTRELAAQVDAFIKTYGKHL